VLRKHDGRQSGQYRRLYAESGGAQHPQAAGEARTETEKEAEVIFKPMTREEYNRLPVQERMEYLQRLMADIQKKMQETKARLDAEKKRK